VNAIAPGLVKMKFSSALWKRPAIYEAAVKGLPQKRMAEPEAIAGIALYLASSASDFTTGATIVVDGGQIVGGALVSSPRFCYGFGCRSAKPAELLTDY